jgi:hypothetical protein
MDCVDLYLDKNQWKALVNTVMNLLSIIKYLDVLECPHNWRLLKKALAREVSYVDCVK